MHPQQASDPPLCRGMLQGRAITWVDSGPREGPCVVMVHGLPGSHRDFRWLAPPLERAGLRVIRLDMPGFGGTEPISPRLSALAEHVLDRLDHLEIERAVLVGHSLGGPQALIAASRDRDRVRGLALISSVGLRPHRGFRAMRGLPPAVNRGLRAPILRRPLMRIVAAGFRRAGFPARTSDRDIRRSLEVVAAVDFRLIENAVAALLAPTLLVNCDDDPLVEPAIGLELGRACPSGPRLRFDDGGHNPQKSQACEIAEVLEPWVRECLLAGDDRPRPVCK
ncbi:alpha/beta hydrolase fold protein [Enhygromyxa salina]|uniref:Alpha/beta hydrolase fold protein n=1 Tax=Enhygromyxa salina TaxID=215803 RepID=A0A0C2CN65_9BACT|nr:alpha/beta hydrolase [Enhygromyxa salina]KIG12671.1 alpha/beta hydrolase fold protein [Enhygromyxa salina]